MFNITLYPSLKPYFSEDACGFDKIMGLQGVVYREVESRKTLRFEIEGRGYFAQLS